MQPKCTPFSAPHHESPLDVSSLPSLLGATSHKPAPHGEKYYGTVLAACIVMFMFAVNTKYSSSNSTQIKDAAACTSSAVINLSQGNLFSCHICQKQYKFRAGLYKHKRDHHHSCKKMSIQCSVSNCRCTFKALYSYRIHLQNKHRVQMDTFVKDFKHIEGK